MLQRTDTLTAGEAVELLVMQADFDRAIVQAPRGIGRSEQGDCRYTEASRQMTWPAVGGDHCFAALKTCL